MERKEPLQSAGADSFPKGEAYFGNVAPKPSPVGEGGRQGLPKEGSCPAETPQGYFPTRIPVTREQRWLLLSALAVGYLFRLGWIAPLASWGGWYGVFWLAAMAAVTPFIWRRAITSKTALAVGIAAIALCVLQIVRHDGSDDLTGFRFLGIPAAMLLYLVFAAYDIPVRREGAAARLALAGVFVYPFSGVPRFFAAIRSIFAGRVRGAWKRVLIGVVIGVPLAVCVAWLLTRADAGMERLFARLFVELPIERWVDAAVVTLGAAMLFYGVFERAIRKEKPALRDFAPASWPASTMIAALIPPLIVYAVFVCLQFSYLFGGALPQALTYSEYARKGFTELNLVAAINFTLFGLTMRYTKKHPALSWLCALLLFATFGVTASCIVRLLLYIGAYGLTMLRILPLWLAIFLAVLTILCAVRLAKERFPVLRVSGIAFLYWFVLLNIPDWSVVIAAYNGAWGFV